MGNRLNQLPPITVRLVQRTSLSQSLLPQPPAAWFLFQRFPAPCRPHSLLALAFLVILSLTPKQSEEGAGDGNHSPQGRQVKKAKKARVFLPGFLCSNLQSPDICKHSLLNCMQYAHLTLRKPEVRKAWRSWGREHPLGGGELCPAWPHPPQTVPYSSPPVCPGL